MAVVFDFASTTSGTGVGSLTIAHTVTGPKPILIATIEMNPNTAATVSNVKFNNVLMTFKHAVQNADNLRRVEQWYMVNPPQGTYNVVATLSTTRDAILGNVSFTGVDQEDPFSSVNTNTGTGTTASVAITTKQGESTVAGVGDGSTPGSPTQTQRWLDTTPGTISGGGATNQTAAGATSVTHQWAIAVSNTWAMAGASLRAASPAGTTTSSTSASSTSASTSSTSASSSSTSFSSTSTSASTSSTSLSTSSTSSSISSTSSSISSTSSSSTSASTSTSSTSSSISSTSQSSTSQSSTSSSVSQSSTSSSFSSTSSSQSSTSRSTSSTSFSSTSSSSSTSTTAIPLDLDYTYQDTLTLPTTGADNIDIDTNKNIMNVAVDDSDYFIQYGSEYMIQEYKRKWTNNTDTPKFTYKGRSTESTVTAPFLIQIYNVNTANWETLAVVNKIPADVDFTRTVTQSSNVSNYYDSNNIVTFRTYQKVI